MSGRNFSIDSVSVFEEWATLRPSLPRKDGLPVSVPRQQRVVKDDFPPLIQGRYLCPEFPDRSTSWLMWSQVNDSNRYVVQPTKLEGIDLRLVITDPGDSHMGSGVHLGELGGVRESRHYENCCLSLICQVRRVALYMRTYNKISIFRVEKRMRRFSR